MPNMGKASLQENIVVYSKSSNSISDLHEDGSEDKHVAKSELNIVS